MTAVLLNAQAAPWLEGRLPDTVEPLWWTDEESLLALAPRAEAAWLDIVPPALAGKAIARMDRLRWYNAMSSGVDERSSAASRCAAANSASSIAPEITVMPGDTPHTRSAGASACASSTVACWSAALVSVYEK